MNAKYCLFGTMQVLIIQGESQQKFIPASKYFAELKLPAPSQAAISRRLVETLFWIELHHCIVKLSILNVALPEVVHAPWPATAASVMKPTARLKENRPECSDEHQAMKSAPPA